MEDTPLCSFYNLFVKNFSMDLNYLDTYDKMIVDG